MHVIIVGAGVVGLSTAFALRQQGAEVTLVERGPIPNPLAASTDHHRLIRYSYGDAAGYCGRIGEALAAWRAMWRELPGEEAYYFADTGVLTLSQVAGDWADRSRRTMERLGVGFERFDTARELERRFPHLETANIAYGFLSEGGALMANRILADLAYWLRRGGAQVLEHSPVISVDRAQGTATLADGRVLCADLVLVTAGVETSGLTGDLGEGLTPHRSVIVYADPPDDLADAYAGAPCWTDLGGESELWGMPSVHGLPMKLGCGLMGRADSGDDDRVLKADEAASLLAAYRGRFRGIDRFRVRFHQANYWTHSPEERFVMKSDDRLWAVSACSGHGFKFGALSGLDIAAAITGAEPVATVARRFAGLAA